MLHLPTSVDMSSTVIQRMSLLQTIEDLPEKGLKSYLRVAPCQQPKYSPKLRLYKKIQIKVRQNWKMCLQIPLGYSHPEHSL